jgi:hypothetical protein
VPDFANTTLALLALVFTPWHAPSKQQGSRQVARLPERLLGVDSLLVDLLAVVRTSPQRMSHRMFDTMGFVKDCLHLLMILLLPKKV